MKDNHIFKFNSEDNVVAALYKIGLLIFIPLVLVFIFLNTDMALKYLIEGGYSCSFRRMTGLYCPGCGGTRASIYLARLKFASSFRMNATVPVSVLLYLYFMIRETLHRIFGIKGIKEKQVYILISIFVITVLLRWVVCNFIMIIPFGNVVY